MYILILMFSVIGLTSSEQLNELRWNEYWRRQQQLTSTVIRSQDPFINENSSLYNLPVDVNANNVHKIVKTRHGRLRNSTTRSSKNLRKNESFRPGVSFRRRLPYSTNTMAKIEGRENVRKSNNDQQKYQKTDLTQRQFAGYSAVASTARIRYRFGRLVNPSELNQSVNISVFSFKRYANDSISRYRRYAKETDGKEQFKKKEPLKIFFRSSAEDGKLAKINVDFIGISPAFSELTTDAAGALQQPTVQQVFTTLSNSKPTLNVKMRLAIKHKLRAIEVLEKKLKRTDSKVKAIRNLLNAKNLHSDASSKTKAKGRLAHALQTIRVLQKEKAALKYQLEALEGRLHRNRWRSAFQLKMRVVHNIKSMNRLRHHLQLKKIQVAELKRILDSQNIYNWKNHKRRGRIVGNLIRKNQALWRLNQRYRKKSKQVMRLRQLQREQFLQENMLERQRWFQTMNLKNKIKVQKKQLSALRYDKKSAQQQLMSSKNRLYGYKNRTEALRKALKLKNLKEHMNERQKQTVQHKVELLNKKLLSLKQSEQHKIDLFNKKLVSQKHKEQHKVELLNKKLVSQKQKVQHKVKHLNKKLGSIGKKYNTKQLKIKALEITLQNHGNLLYQLDKAKENNVGKKKDIQRLEQQLKHKQRQRDELKRIHKQKSNQINELKKLVQRMDKKKQKVTIMLIKNNIAKQKKRIKDINKQMHIRKQEIAKSRKRIKDAKLSRKQTINQIVEAIIANKTSTTLNKDKHKKMFKASKKANSTVGLNSTGEVVSIAVKNHVHRLEQQLKHKQRQRDELKRLHEKKSTQVEELKNQMQHMDKKKQKVRIRLIKNNIAKQKKKIKAIDKQMLMNKQEIKKSKKKIKDAKASRKQAINQSVEAITASNTSTALVELKHKKLLKGSKKKANLTVEGQHLTGAVLSSAIKSTFNESSKHEPVSSNSKPNIATKSPGIFETVVTEKQAGCGIPCINSLLFKIVRRMVSRSWTVVRRVQQVLPGSAYRYVVNATSLKNTSSKPDTAATSVIQIIMNLSRSLNHVARQLQLEMKRRKLVLYSVTSKSYVPEFHTGITNQTTSTDRLFNITTINRALIWATKTLVKQSYQLARRLSKIDTRDSIDLIADIKTLNEVQLLQSQGRDLISQVVSTKVAQIVVKLAHIMHRVTMNLANLTLSTIHITAELPVESGATVTNQGAHGDSKQSAASQLPIDIINWHVITVLRSFDKWSRLLYSQTVANGVRQVSVTDERLSLSGPKEAAQQTADIIIQLAERLRAVTNSLKNTITSELLANERKSVLSSNAPLQVF